ncbi:hypothetical protein HMP0721_1394 [Pseudoramibacter alactolyticus ATCC 23263]|uniref:Uncharacterized protein n=1 Tax=Pseudoramibacter alactolyticus ATCC 23263 TaxID=887929 RepID=E6MHA9_9FIRM|nr:hypothetical protein HMP0721_1394 [Pseudoramibacter alactolyticus ATCC 23263]
MSCFLLAPVHGASFKLKGRKADQIRTKTAKCAVRNRPPVLCLAFFVCAAYHGDNEQNVRYRLSVFYFKGAMRFLQAGRTQKEASP